MRFRCTCDFLAAARLQRPAHVKERYPRRFVPRGDGAPKSANPMARPATRAPRGAPITAFSGNGPCFRPVRRASNAPTDPSASSWQGLLVAPEGAPMPPGCLVATRPAGAAPSSRFTTPHDRAPQWTRYVHDTRALQGGSCAGIISATHSSWPAMTNLVACERKASVIPLSGNTGDQRYSTAPSGAWRCSHPARSSAGVSSSLSG